MNLRKNLTRFSKLTLAAIVAVPAMALSMPALAATTSEGKVELKASSKNVTPVNPIDPTDPTDPTDPIDPGGDVDPVEPVPGLNFVYVSNFDFGQNDIDTTSDMKLYDGKVGINSTNIQVYDGRGAGSGWKAEAQLSKFTDGTNDTLTGSYITLKDGVAKQDPLTSTGAAPTLKTPASTVLNSDNSAVEIGSSTRGNAQGLSLFVWQDGNAGEGTDTVRIWDGADQAAEKRNHKVELTIPKGKATAGTHTATITWTLTDAV